MTIPDSTISGSTFAGSAVVAPQTLRKPQRLLSLDLLRGLTIGFMILVNNAGDERRAYAPLRHAYWNGFTPTDLALLH